MKHTEKYNFPIYEDKDIVELDKYTQELTQKLEEATSQQDSRIDEQIKNMTLDDPSSAEIVDARGEYNTLNKRLNSSDEQIHSIEKQLDEDIKIIFPTYGIEAENLESYTEGDCIIIKINDKTVMIDTNRYLNNYNEIKKVLNSLGITKIDVLIISHYHDDHFNNLERLLQDYDFSNCDIILPRKTATYTYCETYFNQVESWIANADCTYRFAKNEEFLIDNVKFKIFNANQEDYNYYDSIDSIDYNNYSIGVEIEYKNIRALFCGDMYKTALDRCLKNGDISGKYNIVKSLHHGCTNDSISYFFKSANPDMIIFTASKFWWTQALAVGSWSYQFPEAQSLSIPCYILGYQQEAISIDISKGDLKINNNAISIKNSALASLPKKITYYVDCTTTELKRDGSLDYPFRTINEALSFCSRQSAVETIISVKTGHYDEIVGIYGFNNKITLQSADFDVNNKIFNVSLKQITIGPNSAPVVVDGFKITSDNDSAIFVGIAGINDSAPPSCIIKNIYSDVSSIASRLIRTYHANVELQGKWYVDCRNYVIGAYNNSYINIEAEFFKATESGKKVNRLFTSNASIVYADFQDKSKGVFAYSSPAIYGKTTLELPKAFSTANRPTIDFNGMKGLCIFDTTLNKPIWWNGSKWIDANGASV